MPSYQRLLLALLYLSVALSVWADCCYAVVRLQVGTAVTLPGGKAAVDVGIESGEFPTVATVNEIRYPKSITVGPEPCRLRAGLPKTLIASVDAATRTLRVAIAADDNLASIPDGPLYRCDFLVGAGTSPGKYKLQNLAAEIFGPNGEHLRAPQVSASAGEVQVTLVQPRPACAGDCDGDGVVVVADLIAGVRILLGDSVIGECGAADADNDGQVTVADLVRAVRSALEECPTETEPALSLQVDTVEDTDEQGVLDSGVAYVDVCQSLCRVSGNLVDIEFETFTQSRATVTIHNHGVSPVTFDAYTVSIPGSGVPPRRQSISASLPGARCALTARPCAVDSDCSPGEVCAGSQPKTLEIMLYDFVTKELVRGNMRCPSIDFGSGTIDRGNVMPQSFDTGIVFAGTDGTGGAVSAAGHVRAEFLDRNSCGN